MFCCSTYRKRSCTLGQSEPFLTSLFKSYRERTSTSDIHDSTQKTIFWGISTWQLFIGPKKNVQESKIHSWCMPGGSGIKKKKKKDYPLCMQSDIPPFFFVHYPLHHPDRVHSQSQWSKFLVVLTCSKLLWSGDSPFHVPIATVKSARANSISRCLSFLPCKCIDLSLA